jgi:uncharacterized membrane protein
VPILLLATLYSVVVIAVARWRGLRALIGLVGTFAVLAAFVLPGLVEGKPPLLLALVGSTVIMIGMLYFAHGFSARTSTALPGTMFGLGITAALAAWSTDAANLWGAGSSEASPLSSISGNISISDIILCGLIISGLGVLNDVTIAQSSSVWELYELAPETSARNLFTSAMRIGRDHIALTVYTIAFAYAGAAFADHDPCDAPQPAPGGGADHCRNVGGGGSDPGRLRGTGTCHPCHNVPRRAGCQSNRQPQPCPACRSRET